MGDPCDTGISGHTSGESASRNEPRARGHIRHGEDNCLYFHNGQARGSKTSHHIILGMALGGNKSLNYVHQEQRVQKYTLCLGTGH